MHEFLIMEYRLLLILVIAYIHGKVYEFVISKEEENINNRNLLFTKRVLAIIIGVIQFFVIRNIIGLIYLHFPIFPFFLGDMLHLVALIFCIKYFTIIKSKRPFNSVIVLYLYCWFVLFWAYGVFIK